MKIYSQLFFTKKIRIAIFTLSFLSLSGFVLANDSESAAVEPAKEYYINLDKDTIAKGYTVGAFSDNLKLSLVPGILSESTGVQINELDEEIPMPWNLDKISRVYQFEFLNKAAYDNHKPFYIQFSYEKETNNYKQVYFFDKNYNAWRPLPTRDFPDEKFVRSLIHLPFARIAVFDNPEVMSIGEASWYKYKGGNFAASPDFPKGSRIRVYNAENNKFVDVEINDHGPDRSVHPDRVIDLDKIAFSKIASLGEGLVDVRLEPLDIVKEDNRILGIASTGIGGEPDISVKSAVVISEETGEIIYEKNATSTLPLASLSKLVAMKVFLDTRPSLDRVVNYSVKDEEFNYLYCKKWESARLKVNDGDTMTIEDLVYSSLVGSTNNTIETLVRVSGLSREKFIDSMNETVKNWGTKSTKFVEPTGLSPENVSSSFDYAIITKEVFKHPIIQKASTMPEYKFTTINTQKYHRLINTNKIIATNKFEVTGSKTGYLNEAGYCLMMRAKSASGSQVIVVTLGADTRSSSFLETKELMMFGFRKIK